MILAVFWTLANAAVFAASPLRILTVGDSLTHGVRLSGGYREPLYEILSNAGYEVSFLGTQVENCGDILPDCDHEGHDAWRIEMIDGIISSVLDTVDDPDVILLLIGTNDYGQRHDTANATNRLAALVSRIALKRPFAKILLSNLLEREEPFNTQIQKEFNPFVPLLAGSQKAMGREVYFTDIRSSVSLADMPDQTHPHRAGYRKMAQAWFQTITNHFSPEGSTNAPGLSRTFATSQTNITVIFSKPVSEDSAHPTNFFLNGGVSVLSAALDPVSKRRIKLVTTPHRSSTLYTLAVEGIPDRTPEHHLIRPKSSIQFKSLAVRGARYNVAEAEDYSLVYRLDIPNSPNFQTDITYAIDNSSEQTNFSRVAYFLELQATNEPLQFIWVSFEAHTQDITKIGVPTAKSGAFFRQFIRGLNIFSSRTEIINTTNQQGGFLEFWPGNYGPGNGLAVPQASDEKFDWGDTPAGGGDYGSMQIHHPVAGQVLLAFNHWGGTAGLGEVGIGNAPGSDPDWTFAANASRFLVKRLEVYVLPGPKSFRIINAQIRIRGGLALTWLGEPGTSYSVLMKTSLNSEDWRKIDELVATNEVVVFKNFKLSDLTSFFQIRSP